VSDPTPFLEGASDWVRWLIGIAVALILAVLGGLGHLLKHLFARVEAVEATAREVASKGDAKLWAEISAIRAESRTAYGELRTVIESHHTEAEHYRSNILTMMASKNDVHREIDRVIDEIDRVVDSITSVYSPMRQRSSPPRLRRTRTAGEDTGGEPEA